MAKAKAKEDINFKQEKALLILSAGLTQEAAAKAAGVKSDTVSKWMKDPVFSDELRLARERMRHQFESRVMSVANNAIVVVNKMLEDSDKEIRAKGATLALNAAVRLSTRYKELQVEGFVAPPAPMIVLPGDTKMFWAQQPIKTLPPGEVIDAEASEVDD